MKTSSSGGNSVNSRRQGNSLRFSNGKLEQKNNNRSFQSFFRAKCSFLFDLPSGIRDIHLKSFNTFMLQQNSCLRTRCSRWNKCYHILFSDQTRCSHGTYDLVLLSRRSNTAKVILLPYILSPLYPGHQEPNRIGNA